MNRHLSKTRIALFTALLTAGVLATSTAHADPRHRHHNVRPPPPRHSYSHPVVVRYPVGHVVRALPPEHHVVRVGRADYYYRSGVFYRSATGGYAVVAAPVGAFVATLPIGHTTLFLRGRPYYLYNDTYYSWDDARRGYVVVARPAAATESPAVVAYPKEERDPDQQARDRYECHAWAVSQSGFDPSLGNAGTEEQSFTYDRSVKACLEGRGYVSE